MEYPHMPIISYREFSTPLHDEAVKKNIPIAGSVELTLRCNLSCAHCYCTQDINKKELAFSEICRILDEITDAGCFWLLITGGEPLIRPDFLDIYTYAKKKGLIITIFTNGTLITSEVADYLKEWPPFLVEISLYGATQETYEKVTGVPGSYKQCMNGIEMLLKLNIPLKLKTLVTTLNKHELWMMKRYAEERGLNFKFDALINPRLDGSKKPCQVRISPREVVELDLADRKRYGEWRGICQEFWGQPQRSEALYACAIGLFSFHITPYAELCVCVLNRELNLDLRRKPFLKSWKELVTEIRALKPKEKNRCRECELFEVCDWCPAWAKLENDDHNTVVEYICQIAHLRAEAFRREGFILKGGVKDEKESEKTLQETGSI
jgi:radical SAM protein with 4Fe4S-binding SPASM domain